MSTFLISAKKGVVGLILCAGSAWAMEAPSQQIFKVNDFYVDAAIYTHPAMTQYMGMIAPDNTYTQAMDTTHGLTLLSKAAAQSAPYKLASCKICGKTLRATSIHHHQKRCYIKLCATLKEPLCIKK